MKHGVSYNLSGYGEKGHTPYYITKEFEEAQKHDDVLYELRKSVREFVKELLSRLDDTPFKVTLYCVTETNYISMDDGRPNYIEAKLPKSTPLIDFWDALLEVLGQVNLKYEILLSPQQVNDRFILQINSIK